MLKELNELIEALERERGLLAECVSLSDEKKDAIIAEDVARLNDIVGKETDMLGKLGGVRAMIEKAAGGLALELGVEKEALSFNELLEKIDDATINERLKKLQKERSALSQKIKKVNELNKKFLDGKLKYTEVMINALAQTETLYSTYGAEGAAGNEEPRPGLFDQHV